MCLKCPKGLYRFGAHTLTGCRRHLLLVLTYSGCRLECQQCGCPVLQTASAAPSYVQRLQCSFAIVALSVCPVRFAWATPHSPPPADSLFWQWVLRETTPTMLQFGQVGLSATKVLNTDNSGHTNESSLHGMSLSCTHKYMCIHIHIYIYIHDSCYDDMRPIC